MTALLIEAVTSDFFYGWVFGSVATIAITGWFDRCRYKRDTIAIRETMSKMEELSRMELEK